MNCPVCHTKMRWYFGTLLCPICDIEQICDLRYDYDHNYYKGQTYKGKNEK